MLLNQDLLSEPRGFWGFFESRLDEVIQLNCFRENLCHIIDERMRQSKRQLLVYMDNHCLEFMTDGHVKVLLVRVEIENRA